MTCQQIENLTPECPFSDAELAYWDGSANPMGEACNSCHDYECPHNPDPGADFEDDDWGYRDHPEDDSL